MKEEKSPAQMRKYVQSLSPNAIPVLSTMNELLIFAQIVEEAFQAAQPILPSLCPLEAKVSLVPDLYTMLEDETLALDANPRPSSSVSNVDDLERMRERGIDALNNPKGAMLLLRKGSVAVIKDGLHSLRSKVKHDNAEGDLTNYTVRLRFLSQSEAKYFDAHGDNHTAKRGTLIQSTLKNSKGEVLKGKTKKLQYLIAKNLCSFQRSKWGCDFKAASDEVNAMHVKQRKEIEFVCAQGAGNPPWLSTMEKGYHTKSFVLATFIDAMVKFPEHSDRLDDFVVEYATQNYNSKNEHVVGLLNFLKDPPLTVVDPATGIQRASKGSRDLTSLIVKGVSFWISRYLNGEKAMTGRGKHVPTDTKTYHLKVEAAPGVPVTE